MNFAVTGGSGFIGHHLVQRLVAAGHSVVVMDNLRRSSFERPGMSDARCIEGDIRDRLACIRAFAKADVVVHLAAQSNVMGSEVDRDYAFATNVQGTWEVAQAAEASGVKHLIFASSREVYGNAKVFPVKECAPLAPFNFYGASKAAGESVLCAWRGKSLGVSILRLSNVIGSGDCGRVIPLWLERARNNAPLTVYGGKQVLDLVPVDFVATAILRTAEIGPVDGPVNVATGVETRIHDLARHIITLTGSKSAIEIVEARGPEITRFCADTSRIRTELKLTPPAHPLEAIETTW